MKSRGLFDNFTNQYQLSKTLRFELKPIGKDGNPLAAEDASKLFKNILEADRKIKDAYIALKPVMDNIHEQVINKSLTSDEAKQIDFSKYFEKYRQKKEKENTIASEEKSLRDAVVKTFDVGTQPLKEKAGEDNKGKPVFKKEGVKCLTEAGILKYIKNNIRELTDDENERKELETHLKTFEKFFTYFSGYNQNRENYYSKEEKATAVATRIVHDNLPKFCDNCVQFFEGRVQKKKKKSQDNAEATFSRKDEYLNAYQYLKDANRTTQIKDAETNGMIEAYPIDEKMFEITGFPECLSQMGIEKYNRVIGHYNLLINLYNQAQKAEKDFRKLQHFKTLYKQIGCGEKKALFHELKYDTKEQQQAAKENTDETLNLKDTLEAISEAEKTYFEKNNGKEDVQTIYRFIDWLKQTEDWDGIYWSKAAVDKVSDKYFDNWHDIKDRLKGNKACVSYDKKREDPIKVNDAVELSGLFEALNQEKDNGWSEILFKKSVLEDHQSLIDKNLNPSQNLINLICADMEGLAKDFCSKSADILKINDYKNEDNILKIKEWLDTAKSVIWLIKYFQVRESKVKGNPINPELSNMLTALLYSDDAKWFDWYDAVRNYLTKKPQDDAKKNKLKLNFDYGNLLNGFVDSHSESDNATQYGGYLFRKKVSREGSGDFEYFLGISKNAKLFRCHLQDSIQNNDKSEFERLEYYQAKGTTYFDSKYSENKEELIKRIEDSIDEYVKGKDNLKADAESIKKRNKKGEITPAALLERIGKKKEFAHVLNDKNILSLVKQTIQDLKTSCNNFKKRAPKLEEVQKKKYTGVEGYKQIIEDLQAIAKENKVFNFFNVSQKEFNEAFDDETKLIYLFKISNKDLSYSETSQKDEHGKQKRKFKGTENLHTQFFRALMREYNEFSNIDLGKGEVFFRDKAIQENKRIIHHANQPIHRRSDGKKESRFKYPIIKDKRFTEPKYQLHLSVSLNFNVKQEDVTEKINDLFTQTDDIQFLGIDRGEKHLIYYSLVDAKGNIIEQDHFDVINKKDYLQEINEAARKRREKQENWQQKGNISNLKDGYISLVIHEIIQKVKDTDGNFRPTFIVLEDLNTGFKRSRQKFEQQVYQKFELALAKKLNYLVDKTVTDLSKIGSVANALQLTPPVANFQDIENKKQVGIILYTRANYTSVTDPVTGWRKTIYLKKGSEQSIKEQILSTFSEIGVDKQGDYFFRYSDGNTGKTWTLWSGKNGKSLERYRSRRGKDKNEYIVDPYFPKAMLDQLFKDFDKQKSLLEQLRNDKASLSKIDDKNTALRFVIDLIQQIRNSGDTAKGQDDNFLLSPVRNEHGDHFDSRNYQKQKNPNLPKDADANGAYNIARKGIVMYEHIKQWIKDGKQKFEKSTDLDLFISDKEWNLWASDKEQWKEQLQTFASRKMKE